MRSFEEYNPVATAIYFLSVAGVTMFCMNPVLLLLSLFGALLYFFLRNGRKNGTSHWMFLVLFLVMILLNPLVSHNGTTVLFVLNHNPITLEAAIYGIAAAVMILAVLYWFRSFTQIMTSDRLLYLFGKLSPKLALVLSMGLRYVPLFTRQAAKIHQTQTALGLYKEDNIIDRFRGGLRVFSVLITWALENGITTADSMAARGYGIGKRSHFSIFRLRKADLFLLLAVGILLAATLISIGSGALDFAYYPSVQPTPLSPAAFLGYVSYGILILLPTILDAEEKIKWKTLQSKI
ncbi:MAG: energy-coupling factor transporter transmembrane component T [Eubacteriales bacterium]